MHFLVYLLLSLHIFRLTPVNITLYLLTIKI